MNWFTVWGSLLALCCSFDDDRSLGSMQRVTGSPGGTAGAINQPSTVVPVGGAIGTYLGDTASKTVSSDCVSNEACSTGKYCNFTLNCGTDAARGHCTSLPTSCPASTNRETVCGCDGNFYKSACEAALTGVSVTDLSVCPAIPCTTRDDCLQFETTCGNLFGWDAPDVTCPNETCACGDSVPIL